MKGKRLIGIVLVFLLIAAFQAQFLFIYNSSTKIRYVKKEEVFKGFVLTKKLESDVQDIQRRQKSILDTIDLGISNLEQKIQSITDEDLRKELIGRYRQSLAFKESKQRTFNESLSKVVEQYDEQIWNQLDSYIKSYAERNEIEILLSKEGLKESDVFFVESKYDLTDELIDFINLSYEQGGE